MTIKGMVSVIIPSRNEVFLNKNIQDILAKAQGEIEVLVHLDGYWPTSFKIGEEEFHQDMIQDPRVTYIHSGVAVGMRAGINKCANIAKGEFLMKSDAHCMFSEGFDEVIKADIPYYTEQTDNKDDNWIVIPRRKRLDAETWEIQDVGKPDIDYEYLSSPSDAGVKGNNWPERSVARANDPQYVIDETMSFQGSCWFMTKHHYNETIGQMSEIGYGNFVREAQEIGLKTWLSGGRVFTNKKCWYAHLHKGKRYGRMYYLNARELDAGNKYCDDTWFNNRWDGAKYDLAWLIERFSPVPTWTPELIEQVRKK